MQTKEISGTKWKGAAPLLLNDWPIGVTLSAVIRSERRMQGWSLVEAAHRCEVPDAKPLLEQVRLASCGRVGKFQDELTPIPAAAWAELDVVDPGTSRLVHRPSQVEVTDIRVFPVLCAPHAPELLHDRALAEVFMQCVVKDPEVTALGKRVMALDGHQHVFLDGNAPGPIMDYHWLIDCDASRLAEAFINSLFSYMDETRRRPSAAIIAASTALADRIAALRAMLSSGRLAAFGTHRSSGLLNSIHRTQWLRADHAIDVINGDLCEYQNPKYLPVWTGILLERGSGYAGQSVTFDEMLIRTDKNSGSGTTAKTASQCKKWLSQLMRDHPQGRPKPKVALFNEAEQEWSISRRAFERAWVAAIEETNVTAWRSGGRPRKNSAAKTPAPK